MPRKSPKSSKGDTEEFHVHSYWLQTVATNQASVSVSPNTTFSPRLGQGADQFGLFRVRSLKFRLHPYAGMLGDGSVAWIAGVTDTKPSTHISNMECMHATLMATNGSVPSNWVVVPEADLKGYQSWYKTIPGTPDTAQEIPGVLNFVSTNTSGVIAIEVRAIVVLKDPVATGSTPSEVALLKQLHDIRAARIASLERAKLLGVLAPAAGTGTPYGKP